MNAKITLRKFIYYFITVIMINNKNYYFIKIFNLSLFHFVIQIILISGLINFKIRDKDYSTSI